MPAEYLAGGGILALVLGALTALFKFGIPALRNGKHEREDDRTARVIEKELDALGDRLVAEIRESAAGIVARVDLNARERAVERRDEKRA